MKREQKKKQCKKLSKEQKEKIWSKPKSNAGAGWGNPENDYRPYMGGMKKKKSVET